MDVGACTHVRDYMPHVRPTKGLMQVGADRGADFCVSSRDEFFCAFHEAGT
jgi:hypothetical protein